MMYKFSRLAQNGHSVVITETLSFGSCLPLKAQPKAVSFLHNSKGHLSKRRSSILSSKPTFISLIYKRTVNKLVPKKAQACHVSAVDKQAPWNLRLQTSLGRSLSVIAFPQKPKPLQAEVTTGFWLQRHRIPVCSILSYFQGQRCVQKQFSSPGEAEITQSEETPDFAFFFSSF